MMKQIRLFFLGAFLTAVSEQYVAAESSEFLQTAREILKNNTVVDGHNDLPWNLQTHTDGDLGELDLYQNLTGMWYDQNTPSQTDIPRLREGLVSAQFWSLYTRCTTQYRDGVQKALELADIIKRMVHQYNDTFHLATSVQDIMDAKERGLIASLMGLEGGHMIGQSMAVVRMFYSLGIRYITLTHNCNTAWADTSRPENDEQTPSHGGLTDWGRDLVREMNRLGMLVDLSHVSAEVMSQTLNVTRAPVIFSHSSAYGICPHPRNVPDDIIEALVENGGIIMVNFYSKFVNCTEDNRFTPGFRSASVDQVIEHIEHIKDIASVDHIGLGSDYDGAVYVPEGLEDVSKFPNLVARMLEMGWPEEDVIKVIGGNFMRVFQEVEEVRDSLSQEGASHVNIPADDIADLSCRIYPDWKGDPHVDPPVGGSASSPVGFVSVIYIFCLPLLIILSNN